MQSQDFEFIESHVILKSHLAFLKQVSHVRSEENNIYLSLMIIGRISNTCRSALKDTKSHEHALDAFSWRIDVTGRPKFLGSQLFGRWKLTVRNSTWL